MAVYHGVNPRDLEAALASVASQTRKPDEIVVVGDGPLTAELERALQRWSVDHSIRRVDLPVQGGSGPARQAGLARITATWVAIFDADDISLPHRLERQMERLGEGDLDVLGGAVEEFDAVTRAVVGVRRFPRDHLEIVRAMRSINPVNQPAVVVRRAALELAGGYRDLPMLEDYELWIRMAQSGARFGNLPDVLVRFRGGRAMQRRRSSRQAMRSEWAVQRRLRLAGKVGRHRAVFNWWVRTGYRLLPPRLTDVAYRLLFARRESVNEVDRPDRPAYDVYVDMRKSRAPLAAQLAEQALRTSGFTTEDEVGLDVLDVGSGYGDTAIELARRGARVVALEPARDLHHHAVRTASSEGLGGVRFVHGSIEGYRPAESGFDLVIMDNVLEHIDDHPAALDVVSRCLRDGGRLYLLVPNRTWPWEAHYGLPFLAWLPLPLANRYLRLSGRGEDYTDASYAPTYRGLRRALARQGDFDVEFRLPAVPGATIAGAPLHYRVGMAMIDRMPFMWTVSKALLVVATRRPRVPSTG